MVNQSTNYFVISGFRGSETKIFTSERNWLQTGWNNYHVYCFLKVFIHWKQCPIFREKSSAKTLSFGNSVARIGEESKKTNFKPFIREIYKIWSFLGFLITVFQVSGFYLFFAAVCLQNICLLLFRYVITSKTEMESMILNDQCIQPLENLSILHSLQVNFKLQSLLSKYEI